MWLFHRRLLVWITLATSVVVQATVLHTSSRWVVDSNNKRVKLRCVNWSGAAEVKIPEGLASQPVDKISSWIANAGFNCVRLTYSMDMVMNPNQKVSDSFTSAASSTGVSGLTALYNTALLKNPFLASATTQSTFGTVISSLNNHGVMVILDNHNSHASWCCSTTDGNGWWDQASGYNADNSRYFNTANWLSGLSAMATFAKSYPNVVGMSLRNELRASGSQDGNSHADWYTFVSKGASSIHSANADLLVVISGTSYDGDLSYLSNKPLDIASLGLSNKVVWEIHSYAFSTNGASTDCTTYTSTMGGSSGFLLTQGKAYTGPLWLSEFGWSQANPSAGENYFVSCLSAWMSDNDADWAVWALQGSYYVRDGQADLDETFGILNHDWSGWRNSDFVSKIGKMWTVNQGPGSGTATGGSDSTTTSASKTSTTAATTSTAITGSGTAAHYGQCGGIGWTGPTTCVAGTTCTYSNAYYSQCL